MHKQDIETDVFQDQEPLWDSVAKHFASSEDLTPGQIVVITARWILVAAGLGLALWNPDAVGELRVQIMLIVSLAIANFFLHSQLLMGKQVIPPIAYAASAADILVISMIIIAGGGFSSPLYVFYFPAIFAISVAFDTKGSMTFTVGAVALYGLIGAPDVVDGGAELMARMVMMVAVAVCGNVFWRHERERRRESEKAPEPVEPDDEDA